MADNTIILLGKRIKQARLDRDYTLEALASAIGVHKSTIQRYETGQITSPKMPVIEAIANELRVNPSWLIGKSSDKTYSVRSLIPYLDCPHHMFSDLAQMRKVRMLSPSDIAYSIGISTEDYLAIEAGKVNPDCATLVRLAIYYCCSTDEILAFDRILGDDVSLSEMQTNALKALAIFRYLTSENQSKAIEYIYNLRCQQDSLAEKRGD